MAAILVVLAFTALSLTGCDTGDGGGTDPFEGTWIGTNNGTPLKLVAKNGLFTYEKTSPNLKGTYTVSGNTVTLIATHQYENGDWQESIPPSPLNATMSGSTVTVGGNILTKQ